MPENAARRARVARRGALVRRVDKAQEEEDAEEGRSEGVAPSNGGGGGPRQRARASARGRNTGVRRARALRRGQATGRVDEAPEDRR